MTTAARMPVIGAALDRVDGPLKVTGQARYPSDFVAQNMAHAVLVQSTVASGRIVGIDTSAAEAAPGVVAVITHLNVPTLRRGPVTGLHTSPPAPMQDDRILHHGQHVAMVVADNLEQATYAAGLVSVRYDAAEPVLRLDDPRAVVLEDPWQLDTERGDVAQAFVEADVVVDSAFTTPDNTNNPLGLFCTLAEWEGDRLTVHDSTQWPTMERDSLALIFDVPADHVRVLVPFVGGGFGHGLRLWPHVVLTVLAARRVGRPVKLVLTRPQMFTSLGHRPATDQRLRIGATASGRLIALEHRSVSPVAMDDDDYEPVAAGSAAAYACANVSITDRQVRLNIPCPTSMRGPGKAQGSFALESALDELSYALGMDPVELRLRNDADVHPTLGLPWTSRALRECYEVGARRFGWSNRNPEPRSTRDGHWLVGYGMAGVSYPWFQAPCSARASITADGRGYVSSAATDIGTGTYTVMAQLAAETLGLPFDRVRFDLGDSDLPDSPQAGGSGLTSALGSAVYDACQRLLSAFVDLVHDDPGSPLRGAGLSDVRVVGGLIYLIDDLTRCETYAEVLARHRLYDLTVDGSSTPAVAEELGLAPAGAVGAKFVEVHVDEDLGLVRVKRVVSAIDGGRILNEKTATSQIIGGTIGGIGMALLEETVTDDGSGRITNATFGDYLIAVNADVPDLDVVFVGEPDRGTPIGTKGIGEVGLVGVAAAVANAVYHATGKRVRSLPITVEDLL
jgi:CO/xanthine dehydrogenase Mo-binding subunit